jgi:hypothetical protein
LNDSSFHAGVIARQTRRCAQQTGSKVRYAHLHADCAKSKALGTGGVLRTDVTRVTIAFAAPPAQCDPKATNPSNRRRFSFDYFDMFASSVHKWPPSPGDFEMPETNRFQLAAAVCLALTGTVGATEGPWQGEAPAKPASQGLSRDAQRALICQTVADWAAYQVAEHIRDDARKNQAISPEGMQILRQLRLTEGLASTAFDTLAPQVDHDSMYRDAVRKMQAYLKEDHDGADANTQQLVPLCQRTYAKMAAAGELSQEQVQLAEEASQDSVAKLTQELQEPAVLR